MNARGNERLPAYGSDTIAAFVPGRTFLQIVRQIESRRIGNTGRIRMRPLTPLIATAVYPPDRGAKPIDIADAGDANLSNLTNRADTRPRSRGREQKIAGRTANDPKANWRNERVSCRNVLKYLQMTAARTSRNEDEKYI